MGMFCFNKTKSRRATAARITEETVEDGTGGLLFTSVAMAAPSVDKPSG